jgi:hypothetical protein
LHLSVFLLGSKNMIKHAVVAFLLASCKHGAGGSSTKSDSQSFSNRDKPIDCPVGHYVPFSIITDADTPNLKKLDWSIGSGFTAVNAYHRSTARIDVCFDENTESAEIARVVVSPGGDPINDRIYSPGQLGEVKGLKEAVFSDTKELIIGQSKDFPYEIRGVNIDGKEFVALSKFMTIFVPNGETTFKRESKVVVGRLEQRNVWDDTGGCGPSEQLEQVERTVGDIHFQMKTCSTQGVGNTTNYRYARIEIQDPHPSLSEHKVILRGGTLEEAVTVTIEHHNWGDITKITLPEVTYTFADSNPFLHTARAFTAAYANGEVFNADDF